MIRKVLCVGMVAMAMVCGWMLADCLYSDANEVSATVCEVNAEAVAFEDASGEVWVWELEEGESFELGQQVWIEFDDMGTADIYDDEIIQIF